MLLKSKNSKTNVNIYELNKTHTLFLKFLHQMQINNYIPLVYSWAYLVQVPTDLLSGQETIKKWSNPIVTQRKSICSVKELMYINYCTW